MEESQRRLEIESIDLGADIRAVALELINPDDREPIVGGEAAEIWATLLPVLAGGEPFAIDFFAHIERVRGFCRQHEVVFREAGSRAVVIPQPPGEQLRALFERFAGETFGIRAGGPIVSGDAEVEVDLSKRGVDAYHPAYARYLFCAVCDFEGGFLTVLSQGLWASEMMRRARAALEGLRVEVARPGQQ